MLESCRVPMLLNIMGNITEIGILENCNPSVSPLSNFGYAREADPRVWRLWHDPGLPRHQPNKNSSDTDVKWVLIVWALCSTVIIIGHALSLWPW
jgi:hypothetical protein